MHIMIVDDDDDIRSVLGLVLRSEGHQVEEAVDGIDALARLTAGSHPALILLDMMMPRLDGEGFMNTLKREHRNADASVFILSGHDAARQRAVELGAAGCLVKPVELDDLLSVVERVAAKSKVPD